MTLNTSAILPLAPGTWYYRVRGYNYSLPTGAQAMSWSDPQAIVGTKPTFSIVRDATSAGTKAIRVPAGDFSISVPSSMGRRLRNYGGRRAHEQAQAGRPPRGAAAETLPRYVNAAVRRLYDSGRRRSRQPSPCRRRPTGSLRAQCVGQESDRRANRLQNRVGPWRAPRFRCPPEPACAARSRRGLRTEAPRRRCCTSSGTGTRRTR